MRKCNAVRRARRAVKRRIEIIRMLRRQALIARMAWTRGHHNAFADTPAEDPRHLKPLDI